MQLQDAFSIPKIFIGLDIHKKSWTVSIQTDLFFHKTYSISNAEDLYQYVERTFPDHAVDLVYEGVVVDSPRHDIFKLGWNVLVVNPSDVKREIKNAIKKQMH
jgi:hypothetical protein